MTKKDTEVTILIPTFNRSGYLQEAIESALAQTYECEVIVCDHGSIDDTPEVMRKYKDRVKYIRREEDFGPHFCWLDGVLHAKTKYIKILFDDDWLDEEFVERTLPLMEEDVSCVITNANISHENKKEKRVERLVFFNKTGIFSNFFIKNKILLTGGVISPSCVLFRRDELVDGIYQGRLPKRGGNYYHGVGPDMFIMLLGFLRYPKIGFVNDELVTFRAHETSITIDANKSKKTKSKIQNGYEDTIEFYSFLRWFKVFRIFYFFSPTKISRRFFLKHRGFIISLINSVLNRDSF
jgi:glycosyltransferase involved in cell wall biosynthesis